MIECDAPGRLIEGLRQTAPAARDLGTADHDITFGPPLLVGEPAAERQPRLRRALIGALRITRARVGELFRARDRTAAGRVGIISGDAKLTQIGRAPGREKGGAYGVNMVVAG